jgi:hypothetical protein
MSNISKEELDLIKEKTCVYLTKSIHKLCFLLGKDPEQVMSTVSLEELLGDNATQMQIDAITSLYNQATALKKLN